MKLRVAPEVLCSGLFLLAALAVLTLRIHYFGFGGDAPWDAGWYHAIARDGYTFNGDPRTEQNVAFFPLHPYTVRVLARLTSLPLWVLQIGVSIVFSTAGGYFLARALLRDLDTRYVMLGCALVAFSPFAVFLYNGYSESAYFFALSLLLYAITGTPRWALAVLATILASLARPWGVLACGAILAIALFAHRGVRGERISPQRIVLTLCAASLGFVGLTAWFDVTFGDPLLFAHAASVWDRSTMSLRATLLTAEGIFVGLHRLGDGPANSQGIGVLLYLAAIAVTVVGRRWLPSRWFVCTMLHAILFYLLIYRSPHGVLNAGRYSLLLFPAAFYAIVIFRRIDVALAPARDLPPVGWRGARRQLEGEPLPTLGYLALIASVMLFFRYIVDFMQFRWVS